jgi:hypothetical protein
MNKLKDYFFKILPMAVTLAVATILLNAARPFLKKIPVVGNYI